MAARRAALWPRARIAATIAVHRNVRPGKRLAADVGELGDQHAVQAGDQPVMAGGLSRPAFRASGGDLPERLVIALEAGQRDGGDKRGKQSAAVLVMNREEYPYGDVRVDEHRDPVTELRRVFEVARHQLLPFAATFPTRDNRPGPTTRQSSSAAPRTRHAPGRKAARVADCRRPAARLTSPASSLGKASVMEPATETPRKRIRQRFTEARKRGEFLVGAAIGAGILGLAAEQGGADFVLALSAGRFRIMGAASVACMLPIRELQPVRQAVRPGGAAEPVFGAGLFRRLDA